MNDQFIQALQDTASRAHTAFRRVRLGDVRSKLELHEIGVFGGNVSDDTMLTVWQDAVIEPNTKFFAHHTLGTMGAFSYSHSRHFNGLSIGRYCSIASNTRVFGVSHYPDWIGTSSHFYAPRFTKSELPLSFEDRMLNRSTIGHDVWIGSDVALARDISIGDGAVIASGSIVVKDVPAFAVVAGVPAKVKRMRFSDEVIERVQRLRWWDYHLEEFRGFEPSQPKQFLDALEEAIERGRIQRYSPNPLLEFEI